MGDLAEVDLRKRIAFLHNETIELRDWLERRRAFVKSTSDKLRAAEGRLAVLRQQLSDYQMAQKAARDRVVKECLTTELVSVEIAGM